MKIETSYFVQYEDGKSAWYAPGVDFYQGGIILKEERPMLCADEGKMLKHKETSEIVSNIWLNDTKEEDWEEISQEEAEKIMEEIMKKHESEMEKPIEE